MGDRALCHVQLDSFEGPLDLLLERVEGGELDVARLVLAVLAQQVLQYVRRGPVDLVAAGRSVVAAATLVRRKVKALLPPDPLEEEEEPEEEDPDDEGMDPREELERRLEEYRLFKMVAEELDVLRTLRAQRFPRGSPEPLPPEVAATKQGSGPPGRPSPLALSLWPELAVADGEGRREPGGGVDGAALARAFREVLARRRPVRVDGLPRPVLSLAAGARRILGRLKEAGGRVRFTSLFEPEDDRSSLIVLFLSLLDLIRQGRVAVEQDNPFAEIWVLDGGG